ncbi:MAG: class I SAM-dependent methyltransferase [Lachnospiraceae bacterium]|nr:class I SAM-dependent methyltransferase [Lachnospiraceae bacterium]
MESYTDFSKWYDEFMEDVPYEEWCSYITDILVKYGIKEGIVCELGAGTGNFTERLAKAGYDMIGIDNSLEMLTVAQEKRDLSEDEQIKNIMYLCQDMREFELYGTVAAVVSVCDSINYILEDEEVTEVFRLANNYLDPKGLLIFDFNTEYKYREVIGDSVIADNTDEASFIWDNYYDVDTRINEYEVTFFVPSEVEGLYRKFSEMHYQRGYTLDEMKAFIEKAGMIFVNAYDADGFGQVNEFSERIIVVARESGK